MVAKPKRLAADDSLPAKKWAYVDLSCLALRLLFFMNVQSGPWLGQSSGATFVECRCNFYINASDKSASINGLENVTAQRMRNQVVNQIDYNVTTLTH